jgi:AAA15 family ATPase/GTPase
MYVDPVGEDFYLSTYSRSSFQNRDYNGDLTLYTFQRHVPLKLEGMVDKRIMKAIFPPPKLE